MRVLAAALEIHRSGFPVLIAGTNGKGSTAATLASICAAAGLRTALYTSPHLSRVTERIRTAEPAEAMDEAAGAFALQEIPEEQFARLYFLVDETAQRLSQRQAAARASFFESLTRLHSLLRRAQGGDCNSGVGSAAAGCDHIVDPMLAVITDMRSTIRSIWERRSPRLRARKLDFAPHGTLVTLPQHVEPTSRSRCSACARRACYTTRQSFFLDAAWRTAWRSRQQWPRCDRIPTRFCSTASACSALSAGRRASAAQHCTGDCRAAKLRTKIVTTSQRRD